MILDELLKFTGDGDANNEPGTANLGDLIDVGTGSRDLASGHQNIGLLIVVKTAADGGAGGNATVSFRLVSDAQDPPTTDGTETLHVQTPAFTAAQLAAGTKYFFPLPQSFRAERYLGLQVVTATEGEDALTVDAYLSPFENIQWTSYADADNDDI